MICNLLLNTALTFKRKKGINNKECVREIELGKTIDALGAIWGHSSRTRLAARTNGTSSRWPCIILSYFSFDTKALIWLLQSCLSVALTPSEGHATLSEPLTPHPLLSELRKKNRIPR